jgi:hypothetical protein
MAQRKLGEILAQTPKDKGGNPNLSQNKDRLDNHNRSSQDDRLEKPRTLEELGISKDTSSEAQKRPG